MKINRIDHLNRGMTNEVIEKLRQEFGIKATKEPTYHTIKKGRKTTITRRRTIKENPKKGNINKEKIRDAIKKVMEAKNE